MRKLLIALTAILVFTSPAAFAVKKNVAGQHVGACLLDVNGNPINSGTTTVYVVGDGVQSTGTGTVTSTGHCDWDYAMTQAETNFNDVRYVFVNSLAVSEEVEVNPIQVDANGYPINTLYYIDSHRIIWKGSYWGAQ